MITLVEMYNKILEINSDTLIIRLAEDSRTPVEILERIGQEELEKLERATKKDLEKQASIPNTVIFNLVANPLTPVEILKQIAEKAEKEQKRTRGFPGFAFRLKSSLAVNPSIPVELLEKWVEDERCFVRNYIAQNPSIPTEMLEKIAYNEYWEYTIKGQREELLAREDELEGLARNPSTTLEIFEKLVEKDDYMIKLMLAENPSTPEKILEKLAQDEEFGNLIRISVARNNSTPMTILKKLARDEAKSVRFAVAVNSSAPEEILKEFAQEGGFERVLAGNQSTPVEILETLAEDELRRLENDESKETIVNIDVILNLAANPSTPAETLAKLAERLGKTKDAEKIKARLALNPSTPINILEELVQEENMYVYLLRNSTVQELVRSKKDISQEIDGGDSQVAEIVEQIKALMIEDEMLDKEIQKMRELKQEDLSK